MVELTLENVRLNLSGISESEAKRLARLIADALAGSVVHLRRSGNVEAMRVSVEAGAGSTDILARSIADEIVRQIERSL